MASRAIDGYADALASGADQRAALGVRLARLLPRAGCPVDALVAGAATVSVLTREARPVRGRRRFWAGYASRAQGMVSRSHNRIAVEGTHRPAGYTIETGASCRQRVGFSAH